MKTIQQSSVQKTSGGCGSGRLDGSQMNVGRAGGGGSCCGSAISGSGFGISRFSWLGGRRGMIVGAVAVVGAGLAFGWPTLVALGIAPILLSLLPCAAMCALGLCMMGKGRQADSFPSAAAQAPDGTATPALLGIDRPLPSARMTPENDPATAS